jgi:putative ABC transport system permease protein
MLTLKLTLRQLLLRRTRTALTVLAIAFSVSLVVAVTSGFASLAAVANKMIDRYMGSTDVFITAREVGKFTFDGAILDQIRADTRVRKAVGRFETSNPLLDPAGRPIIGRPAFLVGLMRPDDDGGANLRLVEGRWFESSDALEVVLNTNAARGIRSPESDDEDAPAVQVGQEIRLPAPSGELRVKVVGIVHQPRIAGLTIYLPINTLRNWAVPRTPGVLSRILVELHDGRELQPFQATWEAKLKDIDRSIQVRLARTNKEKIEQNIMGMTMLSALGVSVSLVSATCIVFSTLAMGVAERQRQLAMLRAIGALRGQVGRLVIAEGLTLAVIGVAVGVPLGWVWVKLLTSLFHELFLEGAVLSLPGVAYATAACVLTALVATILPAWQATRVSPLEAMSPLADAGTTPWPWKLALVALACISFGPFNLFGGTAYLVSLVRPAADEGVLRGATFWAHFAGTLPLTLIGFFCLSPLLVRFVETVAAPLAARLFALPPALLRQQLAGGLWRAAGTACALMVGLAVLIVMQVQGTSALGAWRLPNKFPDIFILHRGLGGLDEREIEKLAQTPGLVQGDLMPVAIASPMFGNNFLAITGAMAMPESTLFFGMDPAQARRMTELEFRKGDPEAAVALLRKGRHVLITEEFRAVRGLTVGDTIQLRTRKGNLDFTIAGVVWSPGVDVIVTLFDLGGHFEQRTAYSVFGTLEDARELFGVTEVSIFAANLVPGLERDELTKRVQAEVGKSGLQAFDIRHIKAGIDKGLGNLLLMASSVAFAALFVASLGVTNTVMASIRSRRWQFGVLRAVGVGRGQLIRLVLAESVLLGLAACALGLVAGAMMTFNAQRATSLFIGFAPATVVPWAIISIGISVVLAVALLASLIPAWRTGQTPVLTLLQAGRSAT